MLRCGRVSNRGMIWYECNGVARPVGHLLNVSWGMWWGANVIGGGGVCLVCGWVWNGVEICFGVWRGVVVQEMAHVCGFLRGLGGQEVGCEVWWDLIGLGVGWCGVV